MSDKSAPPAPAPTIATRRDVIKLAGAGALAANSTIPADGKTSAETGPGAPCKTPEGFSLGSGHVGLSDRGRMERRRQRPLDLGPVHAHARQDPRRRHR